MYYEYEELHSRPSITPDSEIPENLLHLSYPCLVVWDISLSHTTAKKTEADQKSTPATVHICSLVANQISKDLY